MRLFAAHFRPLPWHLGCVTRASVQRPVQQKIVPGTPVPLPDHRVVPAVPRIVALGGGTGLPTVLEGLADALGQSARRGAPGFTTETITAIVSVTDDGGSSGVLRRDLGVLPPGDIRNCLAALSDRHSVMTDLLQYRFSAGDGLAGHPLGNLLLAGLTELTGNLAQATERLSRILNVRGQVLPATTDDVSLRAEFSCGAIVEGETAISNRRAPIRWMSLSGPARPLPKALDALAEADIIVIGPGSLYTSVLPPLLMEGFADAIVRSGAVCIYVANLMTEPGETDGFSVEDHLNVLRQHVGGDLFDFAIVNGGPVPYWLARTYAARGSFPVAGSDARQVGRTRLVGYDLAAELQGAKIRHAVADLAAAILDVYYRARVEDALRSVQAAS